MEKVATEDMAAESREHVLSVVRDIENFVQSGWVGHHSVRSFITIFYTPLFRTLLGLVGQITLLH